MAALHALALGLLGLLSLTATASVEGEMAPAPVAQIGVQPNPILTADTNATIAYQNPNKANQVIVVNISDRCVGGRTDSVEIVLDANGYGSTQWTVPHWPCAAFNAEGAQEQTRFIASAQ